MTRPTPTPPEDSELDGKQIVIKLPADFGRIGKGNHSYVLYKLLQQFIYDYGVMAEPWGKETKSGRSFNTDQFCKDYAATLLIWRNKAVVQALEEVERDVIGEDEQIVNWDAVKTPRIAGYGLGGQEGRNKLKAEQRQSLATIKSKYQPKETEGEDG